MRASRNRVTLSGLFIPALAAFAVVSSTYPRASTWAAETTSASVREALRIRLEQAGVPPVLTVGGERVHAAETTARFFHDRAFEPAWTSGTEVGRAAHELLATINRAHEEGLDPSHYHAGLLRERLEALDAARGSGRRVKPGELVDLELTLTDAFVLYGSNLLSGHVNPETIDPEWFAARRGGDLAASLERALASDGVATALAALAPPQPGYARLKDALARYRELARWTAVGEGPPLRLGDRGPRVITLRDRLAATGDLAVGAPETPDLELFDENLGRAVQRFQARHGLDVDGVVGKDTVPELDRAVEGRIQQIVVNLERWRWLPQSLGRRHVLVNIPGFELRGVEDGVSVLEMRAIVGKKFRRTPVFSDQISYLVLNPSWTIPPSIAVQDKLPLIREDPSYLARQNIKILSGWGADAQEVDPASIDWATVSAQDFRYRLRQEPGPLNALGTMKFMFPNKFNVYLHDTPSRELFAKSSRDFSSGCIRIERPLDLALFLLSEDQEWSLEKLETLLADRKEQTVKLPQAVPVHIQYWTAWVEDDGSVSFRKDLYGRDDRVADALREPPPATER